MFDAAVLGELGVIRALRALDVPLPEIRRILAVRRAGKCNCGALKSSIQVRIRSIDQRLAELVAMKAELAQLAAQFLTLKQELISSGAAANGSAGGDALQRLDAIEAELTKLTAKTEEVELKLNAVVADGTNRIGDIEFRLCEMTEGCDPSTLPVTPEAMGRK